MEFAAGEFPFPARRDPRTGRFVNLPPPQRHRFRDVLRWKLGLGEGFDPIVPRAGVPAFEPAYAESNRDRLRAPGQDAVQLTWIGHATWLVQVGGINILTDPIYSDHCVPVKAARYRRLSRPGVPWDALPRIDVVAISHAHYDHLDRPTIARLGDAPVYVVPDGVGAIIQRWGVREIHEASWGETVAARGARFLCLPTRHFAARTLFDRNSTLWCSWLIEAAGRRVYFAGDTAYGSFFPELGRLVGPVDAGLIPIGAYQPRWFMREVHVTPDEALKIHRDLGIKRSFAMHWGTFNLTDEPAAEPPIALARARESAGVSADEFRVPAFGETVAV